MKLKNLLILFSILCSCSDQASRVEEIGSTSNIFLNEILLKSSNKGIPGLCQKVEIDLVDNQSNSYTAIEDVRIDLTSDRGLFYADKACDNLTTNTIVMSGQNKALIYFKLSSSDIAHISVSHGQLTSVPFSIETAAAEAKLVLGQPNFTSNTANNSGISASTMFNPYNVIQVDNKLIVSDEANHRILIWNNVPIVNGQAADVVLGQPNMSSNTCNFGGVVSARTLCYPDHVISDGQKLIVTDFNNNRVLIWNTIPTVNQQAADIVIGQPNMSSFVSNNGGLSASSLLNPEAAYVFNDKLFIVDAGNNRILIWNTFPTYSNAPADFVIGQNNFVSNSSGTTANKLSYPYFVSVFSNKLFVSDFNNSRILIWSMIPTISGSSADLVIGQPDLVSNVSNNGGVSAASLSYPGDFRLDNQGRFFVVDWNNHRILIWNKVPTSNGSQADAVIGQNDLSSNINNNGGLSNISIGGAWGVDILGQELWVSDIDNQRILKFLIP